MKRMIFLIIIELILLPAAYAIIEEDWGNYTRADKGDDSGKSVTLNWLKNSYTNSNENYIVTLKDFDEEGNVVLDFNFMGKFETIMLRNEQNRMISTEPMELFDGTMIITPLRISSPKLNFSCCTEVEININVLRPTLKIELNKDSKSEISYRIIEEIPVQIDITNEGDSDITSTVVYIDPDGLILEKGRSNYYLPGLIGTKQTSLTGVKNQTLYLSLKFPRPPPKLNYNMHVYVKGIKQNIIYFNDVTKTITLLPSISITKYVTEKTNLLNLTELENIYPENKTFGTTGGKIYVTLGVTNYQNDEIKGINISDAFNEQLTAENSTLNWSFNLKPFESKEFKYRLNALRLGIFTHPPAVLSYFDLNMSWRLLSNKASTEVSGPCIEVIKIAKSVLTKGENTTVLVTIRNSGDMASRVKVNDTLPANITFIGGKTEYDGYIYAKRSVSFSYNISINENGQIILPEPMIKVNGNDYMGCKEPKETSILVQDPPPPPALPPITIPPTTEKIVVSIQTPVQTQMSLIEKYGWLEGIFPAFMLIIAIVIFIKLHRSSK